MLKRTADNENDNALRAGLPWQESNAATINLGLAWAVSCLEGSDAELRASTRQAYESAADALAASDEPCALMRLSGLCNLAPVDEDIILIASAAHRLLPGVKLTPHLLQQTLGIASPEMRTLFWQRLSPAAPLRTFRLLSSNDRSWKASSALEIEEPVLNFLFGTIDVDGALRSVLHQMDGGLCPERHWQGVESLFDDLRVAPRARALIIGNQHSGRHAAARRLAQSFGLALFEVRAKAAGLVADFDELIRRDAKLASMALLLDMDDADARALLDEQLHHFDGLIIGISETQHDLTLSFATLRLEPLELADHRWLWAAALAGRQDVTTTEIDALATQFKFGPRAVKAVAAQSKNVWQACRELAHSDLAQLAERVNCNYGWDDIVLPAVLLAELKAAVNQVRFQHQVYGHFGFGQKNQRGRGVSVLLSGASGVGKTMAAEVMARDLALDLYRVDLSRVVSKYIGESEKKLRQIFDAAEASGAILLFDEADALFGKRSEVKDAHDRFANIEVSYLLQRMESYSGMAILSTNLKSHIDTAFMRRLRFVIDIPFPDSVARRSIWEKAFPDAMPRMDIDYDALARLDIAGGNIVVIAINAAFLAAADKKPVSMVHIAQAAQSEFRKIDREFRATWQGWEQNG